MIGTLLCGRYRLEDQVGAGGMSTVYRAFDETLERWVAIKVLHGALVHDPLQLERFRREARTVARLSHPHIVNVIDAGEDNGQPFIVLEYVDGETLKARVRRLGRLDVEDAIAYAIEIGRALMAAHAERLVHRDVKPQNVLIDADSRAKVTDFGISRSLEDDGLTATGRVLGTTDYVAPEQALGEGVGAQSDVYSLGVCLYEMLTGEVPFKADSQVGVAMKHVREPLPDVRTRRPEVSASLAAVVERATAKECENRYPDAASMIRELDRALTVETSRAVGGTNGEPTTVLPPVTGETRTPERRRRRPRLRTVLGLLAAAAIVVGAAAALALQPEHRTTTARPVTAAAPQRVHLAAAAVYDPFGDGNNAAQAGNAIDGNPTTTWPTEQYYGGLGQKPGVGIDVDAGASVPARTIEVLSHPPGAYVKIFGQNVLPNVVPGSFGAWGNAIGQATLGTDTKIPIAGGRRYRFYLVWITRLPPSTNQANIDEIKVLQNR